MAGVSSASEWQQATRAGQRSATSTPDDSWERPPSEQQHARDATADDGGEAASEECGSYVTEARDSNEDAWNENAWTAYRDSGRGHFGSHPLTWKGADSAYSKKWSSDWYSDEWLDYGNSKNSKDDDAPEWDGKAYPLKTYFRKIDIWLEVTRVDPWRRGVKLLQALKGDAFEKLELVDPKSLKGIDGVEKFKQMIWDKYEPLEKT